MVICTGDIFRHPSFASAFYLRNIFVNQMKKPYFCTPGNHDIVDNNSIFYRLFCESLQYYFSCGDTLFIVADTSDCSFDNKRFDYLKNILKKHRSYYRRCVIITHTPPISSPSVQYPANKEFSRYLHELSKEFMIDAIICGHFHIAETLNFNDIPVYISHCSGQKIRSKKTPYFGYLLLHFKEDGSIHENYIFKPELKRSRNYFHGFILENVLSNHLWLTYSVSLFIAGIFSLAVITFLEKKNRLLSCR